MLKLNNLKSPKGAHKNIKRIGRGEGSGQGTQAGKGHKGQKARSGGGVRTGFEGGGLPLYMRLPKWGTFKNARFKKHFAVINLEAISKKFAANEEVSPETLQKKGFIKGIKRRLPVKILAKGEKLGVTLSFKGIKKFSKEAQNQIQSSGGTITE